MLISRFTVWVIFSLFSPTNLLLLRFGYNVSHQFVNKIQYLEEKRKASVKIVTQFVG